MKSNSILMAVVVLDLMFGGSVRSRATPLSDYQAAVLAEPSLISYYEFDASNANDVKSAHHGTLAGTAGFVSGISGGLDKAVSFNTGGWVNLGAVPAFDFSSGKGTVEMWVQLSTIAGNECIVSDRNDVAGTIRYSVFINADRKTFLLYNNYGLTQMALPFAPDTGWHHLAVVFNSGNWSVIWDGQQVDTVAQGVGISVASNTQLGAAGPTGQEAFNGKQDEVAFYSTALPLTSIQAHRNAYLGITTPVITTQPQGGSGVLGEGFQMTIVANAGLSYQWYDNSARLTGRTNTVLALASLALTNAGTYTCVVANGSGSVTSSPAVLTVSALATPVANYQAAVQAESSLISYYKFDDHTPKDSKGVNHGALVGTANFSGSFGDAPGSALNLDGGGWDNLGVVPAFDFRSGNGTVELWVRAKASTVASGSYPCIIANGDGSGRTYAVHLNPGANHLLIGPDNIYATLPATLNTSWHQLALIFTNNTLTVVWDGQSLPFSDGQTPHPFTLGTQGFGHAVQLGDWTGGAAPWGGNLDEVAFYSAALPLSSIQAHHEAYTSNFMVFPVSSFGAVANSTNNSGPAIRQAIATAISYGPNRTVTFQPGTYRISPDGNIGWCLNMAYANGLSLQGSGTTLIVTDPLTGGLSWTGCTNCSISGITIDYDPLPFTQGTITAINKGAGTFDVTLASGYPLLSEARFTNQLNFGLIMDVTKPQPKAGANNYVPMTSLSLVSGTTYRLKPIDGNVVSSQITVNDRFVYAARNGACDLLFNTCNNCRVQNVTVNTGPSIAIVLQGGGSGMVITNFSLSFPTNSGRLLTTDADGVWCGNLRGGPVIANSYFEGMADDGVNIHSFPNPVLQVYPTNTILVGINTLMQVGDRVQAFDIVNGNIRGETTVTKVTPVGENYQLTLAASIPNLTAGTALSNSDSLFNLSASGEGYLITNNVINAHRARGILLRTGNGTVISNKITGASMNGILIMNDCGPAFWEGPLASNIVVRGNIIDHCGYAGSGNFSAIEVVAYKYGYLPASGICQRNITIENNIITNWPQMGIHAVSVTNLQVFNNQIQCSATANSYGGNIQGMVFENSSAIMVNGGRITDPRANLHAGIHILNTVATGTPGFSTNNLTFSLVSGVTKILDDRPTGPANATPSIAAVSTQTIVAGATLILFIRATDATLTPLYFNMVSGPVGAAFNDPLQLDGILTWRPTISQAGTNQVVVKVQDNGSPNLSATQTFQIVVMRPAHPSMSAVTYNGGNQFSMSITGPAGLDYIVQTTTNLSSPNWVGARTHYSAVPPILFTDTLIPGAKQQFYRVLLGP
jgi:Concanavalin A-like lectin/glucanases superfamily/Right handed beta helix region/Immunoglobulin domain